MPRALRIGLDLMAVLCISGAVCIAESRAARAQGAQTCTRNRDCPGDDVCAEGVCSGPSSAAAAAAAAQAAAPARANSGASCVADNDCKGRRVCRAGACVPPATCGRDRDCPGEEICAADKMCRQPTAEELNGGVAPAPAAVPQSAPPKAESAPAPRVINAVAVPAPSPASAPARAAAPSDGLEPPSAAGASPRAVETSSGPSLSGRFEADAQMIRDKQTMLAWQRAPKDERVEYEDAASYCHTLALGGPGWRVPSLDELLTLSGKLAQPQVAELFGDVSGSVWSSTEEARLRQWAVSLRVGTKFHQSVHAHLAVRCVRPL